MRELSQHITDLVENSTRAGARRVVIEVEEDTQADLLTIRVADDGRGMPTETVDRVTDPFYTTRACRRVGLGLPLLEASAQRCGGSLRIESSPGRGTEVTARFRRSHVDRPPMGDLQATLIAALVGHPDVDVVYRHRMDGRSFELDGAAIKRELEGIPLAHPSVLRWLEKYLSNGLSEVGGGTPPL
ncbi:MAG: ATP-binding protein [Sphingomonadaceae bacterium]